jgi:hypothetical protein
MTQALLLCHSKSADVLKSGAIAVMHKFLLVVLLIAFGWKLAAGN